MDEEFLEPATKAILTMAATMLLHQSDALDELHRRLQQTRVTETSRHEPYDGGPLSQSQNETILDRSLPTNVPITESFIDSLEHSQTVRLSPNSPASPVSESDESFRLIRTNRPVKQRVLRDTAEMYRSYEAPPPVRLAETPDPEYRFTVTPPPIGHHKHPVQRFIGSESTPTSARRGQSTSLSSQDESFRIVRPARPPPLRQEQSNGSVLERSYVASRAAPTAYFTPRRYVPISPGEDLDAVTMPDQSLLSFSGTPTASHVGWRDPIREPVPEAAREPVPDDEDSFRLARPAGGIRRRYDPRVDPGSYRSFESTHPIQIRPLPEVSIDENLDSILLSDVTLPSFAESSLHQARTVSYRDSDGMHGTMDRSSLEGEQEYLDDIEPDFAPDLNSTIISETGEDGSELDETIHKLLNRISRQVERLRADERIGILRRSSDDYDFALGRMRDP